MALALPSSLSRPLPILVSATALFLVLAACGDDEPDAAAPDDDAGTDDEAELVQVDYFLPFLRSIAFWPTHVAEEVGYFAEEGLSVESEATDGSSFVVQQVTAGSAEFGIAVAEPILLGAEQSDEFTSVYEFLTGNVFDLWVLDDSEVQQVSELPQGSQIIIEDLAGGDVPGLNVLLDRNGLTVGADVDYVPAGDNTALQAQMLADGEADAINISWNRRVGVELALLDQGIEMRCLTCDEAEALGSESVIVSNDFLEQNHDLVVGHGRALAKATLFGQTNPEAALEIMRTVNPEEHEDEEYTTLYFDRAIDIMTPRSPQDEYGWHDPDAWQRSMELLLVEDIPEGLSEPLDVSSLINNDLVAEYNDFDHDEVIQQAEEWSQ